MAVEKVVNITVNNNIDKTTQDVNQLNNALSQTAVEQSTLKSSMKDSQQSILDNGGAIGLLNDATGGLASTVKDAVEASGLFAKQSKIGIAVQSAYTAVMGASTGALRLFKLALIGTGIGAIVVGLGLLIANFDKVKVAVLNLVPGLAQVGEFIGNIVDAVTDFVGVTSDATRELDRLGDAADKTLAKNKLALDAYGDKYDEFTKRKIEANNTYAQHVKDIQENEELTTEQKLAQLKLLRARADREIIDADNDRETKLKEARDKRQKEIDDAAKAAKEKQDALDKERAEREKKLREDNLKAFNEFQIQVNNAEFAQRELELENAQAQSDEILRIATEEQSEKDKIDAKGLENEKVIAEAKKQIQQSTIDTLSNGIGLLKQIAGKNKALQASAIIADSALGIAKIVISTQTANAAAIAKYAAIPGGAALSATEIAFNRINAGIGIASNVLATKQALSAIGGGGSPQSGNSNSGGGSTSAPQFNVVGQSGTNQLAQSISGKQNQPIKAYVVSGDVTSAQQLDRNKVQTASFP